jgi:hypothetical protein
MTAKEMEPVLFPHRPQHRFFLFVRATAIMENG